MIVSLHLSNFRGFKEHEIPIRPVTILVGENNAGKSTITEALRLTSIVTGRYGRLNFTDRPTWSGLPRRHRGVRPSIRGLDFNPDSVFYNLGRPPAIVSCEFDTGSRVDTYIGPHSDVFSTITDPYGNPVNSKAEASAAPLPSVAILPQIGPLSQSEVILDTDYVRSVATTPLASAHFRNHLKIHQEDLLEFKALAEETWPELRIRSLEGAGGLPGDNLALLLQDGDFVAEACWMGHGLQMWLQTMWFLARSKGTDTIILDEPDVYMHADLQRKLIRLLKGRHPQTVVATHSTEIIAEVEPEDILVIDRRARKSRFAPSLPSIQRTLEQIGTIHNLQLTRLWKARRMLLLEGKELRYLKAIQDTVFPQSQSPVDAIPNFPIGGWSGWPYAIGSNMALKNAAGEGIRIYCILDSDFHTSEEKEQRLTEAHDRGISLHIWRMKEIENYVVVPSAIHRLIQRDSPSGAKTLTIDFVASAILDMVEQEHDRVFDNLANEFLARDRAAGLPTANKKARDYLTENWTSPEGKLAIVSGKRLISKVSNWAQRNFRTTVTPTKILKVLLRDEVPTEMVLVIRAIERGRPFISRVGSA